ncbi:MAG TPA: hypothetical protein VFS95_07635 [Telluria sp.]|nr:hypothetical protein [Telluria sp.]
MKHLVLLLACMLGPVPYAAAATPAEDAMNQAPMPHAKLGGNGPQVLVHWARLQGTPGANAPWKAQAQALREDVQRCVAAQTRNGQPVHPPTAWPDYSVSVREDTYGAINRSITYTRGLAYLVNGADCSLIESKTSRARLVSNAGACDINLIDKTASGECDVQAHAKAAPPRTMQPTEEQKKFAEQARNGGMGPEMAAMFKQMEGMTGGATGVRKTIAGLACEVFSQGAQLSACLATGGSFSLLPSSKVGVLRYLALETTSQGFGLTAVEARLDQRVSAALFAPHLAGGFTITKEPQ